MKKCCICGKEFEGWGNDPWGAAWLNNNDEVCCPTFKEDDECCDDCNSMYVIPGRLLRMKKMKEEREQA